MTISKALIVAPQVLCAGGLLLLCSCEPHSAEETRAFWSPKYEHQLHAQDIIPQHERFYFVEAGQRNDPVMRTNLGDPRDYQSMFRDVRSDFPPNVAAKLHFPAPLYGPGHGHADANEGQTRVHEVLGHEDDAHVVPAHTVPAPSVLLEASEVPGSSRVDRGLDEPHTVTPARDPHAPVIVVDPHAPAPAVAPQERRSFFPPSDSGH